MNTVDIDFHIAEKKLNMVKSTGFGSSFTTIWCGSFIHIFWNNASREIVQIWPDDVVGEEDMGTLNFIIDNFYKIYCSQPLTNT